MGSRFGPMLYAYRLALFTYEPELYAYSAVCVRLYSVRPPYAYAPLLYTYTLALYVPPYMYRTPYVYTVPYVYAPFLYTYAGLYSVRSPYTGTVYRTGVHAFCTSAGTR